MDISKNKLISSFIWKFAERCGAQIIQFVLQIVLARLLTPEDYGLIGLITVFISISLVFAQSGLGQALVQKKTADKTDFSTVFYFSLAFSIILYIILFLCAPLIAGFYDSPQLTSIVRVLGITVIFGAINSVQQAYVQKTMQFKKFFCSTLGATFASAIVGISMAYDGCGVWALVGQQITTSLFSLIILWFTLDWKPSVIFSIKRMKSLFSFGWKLLCSSLIDTVYNNMYSLIIGKFYSKSDLGYYNRGQQFPMLVVQNINSAIDSVIFPVMSEVQDEKDRLKAMVRRSIVTSTFLIFPAMAGLAAIAKPLVVLLLTEKWLPAVPFIQFCCFIYAFWPTSIANLQAIKAVGRSDIYLKLEIIKKLIGIAGLCASLPFGINCMMWVSCLTTVISSFVNAYPNKKLLNYSYLEQLKDIFPSMALSLLMCGIVLLYNMLNCHVLIIIGLQLVTGAVVYLGCAKILKFDCLEYMINTVKGMLKK